MTADDALEGRIGKRDVGGRGEGSVKLPAVAILSDLDGTLIDGGCRFPLVGGVARACVVLEDAPSGVQSGYRAGMRVIGILSSYCREHLAGAAVCIRSLRNLPGALAALGVR